MNTTEYREIPGFPGYRAGSDGTIWSCRNNRWGLNSEWRQLQTPVNNVYGRRIARLGRARTAYLHHLILEAFVGPRPTGMEAIHIDGNAGNNSACNLRWGTRDENLADMRLHGRKKGERHHNAVFTEADIRSIRIRVANGESRNSISKEYGVGIRAIGRIVDRTRWGHIP